MPDDEFSHADASLADASSQTGRAFLGLRELILRGEFEAGQRISEVQVSERLGVSRTPVRVALQRLSHLGLLHARSKGGFEIRKFTIEEVRDAIELRGVLEGTAARLAAERLEDVSELDALHSSCRAISGMHKLSIDSFAEYIDLNCAVHAAIVDLAKNEMLRRMIDYASSLPFASTGSMVFPTSMMVLSEQTLAIADSQHWSILEAIKNREGTRAEHLAREHARIGWQIFQVALSDNDVLRRVPGSSLISVPAD